MRDEIAPPVSRFLGNKVDKILSPGLLNRTGVLGVYARGGEFERVIDACTDLISRLGVEDNAETLRFPPVMDRQALVRNGYFVGFPHLAGCVHSFVVGVSDHARLIDKLYCDDPVEDEFAATECVLAPAACYPVYPLIAARGALADAGALIDVESYCFRREPSDDPARMQSFRMREYVRIGRASDVLAFRDGWLRRAEAMTLSLGLDGTIKTASDPFFGSRGAALSAEQVVRGLKYEMLIAFAAPDKPTACMSFNYHEGHFASAYDIRLPDEILAHTACVGFGLERLALALFTTHGIDASRWPAGVREVLWPTR